MYWNDYTPVGETYLGQSEYTTVAFGDGVVTVLRDSIGNVRVFFNDRELTVSEIL